MWWNDFDHIFEAPISVQSWCLPLQSLRYQEGFGQGRTGEGYVIQIAGIEGGTCGNYDNLTEPHCRFLNKEFHGIPVRQSFIQIRWSRKSSTRWNVFWLLIAAPVAMVPTGGKICGGHRQRHQDWGQAVTHRVGEVLQWDFFNFGLWWLCRTVSPTRALLWPATAMFFIRSCPARRGDEGYFTNCSGFVRPSHIITMTSTL